MLNLIDQIIEIDKNARAQVESADRKASGIMNDTRNELESLQREFDKKATKRLQRVEDDYQRMTDAEIEEIESALSDKTAALENVIAQNGARWESEIIARITGQ